MPEPITAEALAPSLLALLDASLAALHDPDAGAALYGIHAPDAPLRSGAGIALAGTVSAAEFARQHRDICLAGREQLPRFERDGLLSLVIDPASATAVAWFTGRESRQGTPLTLGLGARLQPGGPRLGWCAVVPQVPDWTYAQGMRQSLADFPWMRTASPARARALIDASFFRRYWRAPLRFSVLPDARFVCRNSGACCRHDYEAVLPPEAQLVIDSLPWESLSPGLRDTRLARRADGNLQLKAASESCRFLDADRRCLVHLALGRQPFGPCSSFPYTFAQTPEAIAVAMSPICEGVRVGAGAFPLAHEEDLRERLVQSKIRQPDGFRLAPGVEIPWERFRDTEAALCELLATDSVPLRMRLYLGCRLLEALRRGAPVEMQAWLRDQPPPIDGQLRQEIHVLLGRILDWDRATFRTLPKGIPAELRTLEPDRTDVLVRILRNTAFSKVYSYPYDLTTAHNLQIIVYLLALVLQSKSSGPMSPELWQELGSLGVHGLLGTLLQEGVPEGFRQLLGSTDFGLWLLAA